LRYLNGLSGSENKVGGVDGTGAALVLIINLPDPLDDDHVVGPVSVMLPLLGFALHVLLAAINWFAIGFAGSLGSG
jgi:hypothetical protein